MSVQDKPLCFYCVKPVEHSPVFAAACDHETCPSAVFHGLCLMEYREHRDRAMKAFQEWLDQLRRNEETRGHE